MLQSDLTVYNKNQRVIFSWKCAKENIVAIDISDNGKLVAVSVVGAENGELYSRVLIFDFSYEEAVSEFDFGSDIISGVNFLKGDTLLITGENVFSIVKNKTDKQDEDLSLNSLSRISVSDNNVVAAVLSKYGSSSAKILNVYNRNGEKLFTVDITSAVKSVSLKVMVYAVFLTVLIRMYILRLRFPHIVQTAIPRMTRQQSLIIVNILLICLLGCCMVV